MTQKQTAIPIYRIKGWDANFENNRTRDMKNMAWIPVPNKHDGDGYTELVDHKDGAAHLGAWLAILQTASKCAQRGTLLRDNGHPHTARTISRLSRLDEGIISETLNRLCSFDIGWVEVLDADGVATIPHEGAGFAHPVDEEQKGTEQNGTEEKVLKVLPDESVRLANLLIDHVQSVVSNPKSLNATNIEKTRRSWAESIDMMNRLDFRKWSDIESVIAFVTKSDFWAGNILSGSKLRKQYEQIEAKANTNPTQTKETTIEDLI